LVLFFKKDLLSSFNRLPWLRRSPNLDFIRAAARW